MTSHLEQQVADCDRDLHYHRHEMVRWSGCGLICAATFFLVFGTEPSPYVVSTIALVWAFMPFLALTLLNLLHYRRAWRRRADLLIHQRQLREDPHDEG
jgi:hypothetical protein